MAALSRPAVGGVPSPGCMICPMSSASMSATASVNAAAYLSRYPVIRSRSQAWSVHLRSAVQSGHGRFSLLTRNAIASSSDCNIPILADI